MIHHKKTLSSGFALLITLVIISVVISIGITLVDLTLKQLRLANNSKDSESAFHAANAGAECVRYWRIKESDKFEAGLVQIPVTCFDAAVVDSVPTELVAGSVYRHDFEISWAANTRCSKVRMITISSDPDAAAAVNFVGIQAIIPGYPVNVKSCNPGGRCSIISVQGYNRSCANINEIGTIQREVLLDL